MGKNTTPRKPIAEPQGGWPLDKFHGRFGSFMRDAYSGTRFPADEATSKAFGMPWPPAQGSEHAQAFANAEEAQRALAEAAAAPAPTTAPADSAAAAS